MIRYQLLTLVKKLAIALHLRHEPRLIDYSVRPTMGLNARYHGDEDGSPTDLVTRAAIQTPDQLAKLTNGKFIVLIETLDKSIIDTLAPAIVKNPNVIGVELGNEIDLTDATPEQFGDFLEYGCHVLESVNFTGDIITGGISRVTPDRLSWLGRALVGLAPRALVGIHRYSINNDAMRPQEGYVNRDEECIAINRVVNGRKIVVTEFGYPIPASSLPSFLDQVRNNIRVDTDYWSKTRAKYLLYYQWLCGPTDAPIDRFGLRRPDGSVINLDLLRS